MKDLFKDVFERNCHFTQAGILDEIMNIIHSLSLSYKQSKTSLNRAKLDLLVEQNESAH